ncbi:MAG TPA: hypothetical protein VHD62_13265 [Opitutaceae bacterium]|nr:hypothetical protein [Opitutaceae bacterium]
MIARRSVIPLVACVAILGACRRAEVTAYRVPKEKEPELPVATNAASTNAPTVPTASSAAPAADAGNNMAATAVPTAEGAGLAWTAPASWKAKPLSPMRKGSYAIPGDGGADAELSITAFPNSVGGELANVNRWRGQVQLGPIAEADLAGNVTRVEHNGLSFTVVDATGPGANPQRLLAAMTPFAGGTWFFKLGPASSAIVAREKNAFLDFLATVKPANPTAP